jgi:chromosome segregation ATPase
MDPQTLTQAREAIATLTAQIEQLTSANATLQTEVTNANATVGTLTTANAELTNTVAQLNTTVGTLNQTIAENAETITRLTAENKTSDLKAAGILAEVGQPAIAIDITADRTEGKALDQYAVWAKKLNKGK